MTLREICLRRLEHQHLSAADHDRPAAAVAALVALQAQDYLGALWSVGLRTPGSTEADIEAAIAQRTIVRTWVMRGTLHFVAAADVRWMLALLTPRILDRHWTREKREFGFNARELSRGRKIVTRALRGRNAMTRDDLYAVLEKAKISTAKQRGYHILWRLAQEGLICCGPRMGKQPAFVLLDDWVPASAPLARDAALALLARRYFQSHGPATLNDFAGWAALPLSDARAGLEAVAAELESDVFAGTTHWFARDDRRRRRTGTSLCLLPGFDEYLLGYKDRRAALDPPHAARVFPGSNGLFLPTIVVDGRVVGTWRRTLSKRGVAIQVEPFRPLKNSETTRFRSAAKRYGQFLGLNVLR